MTRTLLLALSVLALACASADTVLAPLKSEAKRGPNRVANPGFEDLQDGKPTAWHNDLADTWTVDPQVAHSGKGSLSFAKPDAGTKFWISQSVTLNQTEPRPLVIGAWSKAEGAEGSRTPEYSVWVDLAYMDGTPLYGQRATFEGGTHDWQHSEHAFTVSKPVRSATVHLLFRNGVSGKVWFDDVSLQELQVVGGGVFDRASVATAAAAKPGPPVTTLATKDGLQLRFDAQGRIAGFGVGGKSVLGTAPGGMWLRDVGADGPWLRPEMKGTTKQGVTTLAGETREAGLKLTSDWQATDGSIEVHATVQDLTGKDRAVTAYFVLPVANLPWTWHDDLMHALPTGSSGEYTSASGWPIQGISSAYPWCSLTSEATGLSLAVPMDCPRIFRLTYNSTLKALYLAVNLGLVKDTAGFPSQADFGFSLFRHDPRWGFRSATERYQQLYPQFFVQRLKTGGPWNAFADISKIRDWQDFGFAYDEHSETPLAFDRQHGITSFSYIEPMTYWLAMDPKYARTYEGAMQALKDSEASGNAARAGWAKLTLRCGDFTHDGKYDLSVQNQAWCDGAVFTLNPDPNLPEDTACPQNKAHWSYNKAWADKNIGTGPTQVDGIYLDSLPNWGEVRNWRREHWRTVNVPLTFDPETKEPVLIQMFSTYQFARWVADDVHARGGAMHGNGGVLWPFFPALLDTTGQETGAILTHEAMGTARALLGNKPYSPLLNTEFNKLPPTYNEDYFHRSALYCIFPSYFNGDVFVDGKWKITRFFSEPALYDKVRPLYQQFIPVLRRMFAAGWQPVTHAAATPAGVKIERYGPGGGKEALFAVFNDSKAPVTAQVRVDVAALKVGEGAKVRSLLKPGEPPVTRAGTDLVVTLPLEPQRCEVLGLEW